MRLSSYIHFAVDQLLQADSPRLMEPVPYDTVWAARLTNADGSVAYPATLDWLVAQQQADGSWGSQIPYVHDRLLTTLAVVVLLARADLCEQYCRERQRGEQVLWQLAGRLHYDYHETIGFELILPTLLAEAKALGLNLPYAQLQRYECERVAKLRLLPLDRLFTTQTTALFSLEAFGECVDPEQGEKLLLGNGSLFASPSATAYLLSRTPDWRTRYPQSTTYVDKLLSHHDYGLPHVAPYDVFATAWSLTYLHYGGLLKTHTDNLQPYYTFLRTHWRADGIGYSSVLETPDCDEMAMTLMILHRAGYPVDSRCLLAYERPEHFACFLHERNPSLSANLHVLAALALLPEADQPRVRDKILGYLLRQRHEGAFWSDKWHASVYYPTSRALIILTPYLPEQMAETLRWLLATQQANGAWGQYMPTLEETALVLLALLHYHRHYQPLAPEPLQRAAAYLLAHEQPFAQHYPALWIGKALYAPTPVIRSCILAALGLYVDTFPNTL